MHFCLKSPTNGIQHGAGGSAAHKASRWPKPIDFLPIADTVRWSKKLPCIHRISL